MAEVRDEIFWWKNSFLRLNFQVHEVTYDLLLLMANVYFDDDSVYGDEQKVFSVNAITF